MPLPSFSGDIEKNIIRHIKYRGTIRTGEIIVDNGDGTYDVKIALSDVVYPSIETIHYEMKFAVGEIAVLAFEYGSKESPKIIGHGKKIAQVPVEVEVDYSGAAPYVGSPAIIRSSHLGYRTVINKNNPANISGKITSIEIWSFSTIEDCKVAIFYTVGGNVFSTRNYAVIGTVPGGSKQIFAVNLNVRKGDYIGMYYSYSGAAGVMHDETGGAGVWWKHSDYIPCTSEEFSFHDGWIISLCGKSQV